MSAEAYSCSEAIDNMFWLRAVMAELFDKEFTPQGYEDCARKRRAAVVTDCRSLWDCLVMERVNLSDRRLSLEAAILRQECKNCELKWVKSEQ